MNANPGAVQFTVWMAEVARRLTWKLCVHKFGNFVLCICEVSY